MPGFSYLAVDQAGKEIKGSIDAEKTQISWLNLFADGEVNFLVQYTLLFDRQRQQPVSSEGFLCTKAWGDEWQSQF